MIGVVFQDSVLDGPLTVKDSFKSSLPEFLSVSDKLINGTVAAQLAAALLAVSCVTVTFCVNLTMIQDKANGARKDFNVSPTGKPVIYLGYFFSTVFNSLIVNGLAFLLCMGYIRKMGWYLNASDILYLILDVIVLVIWQCAFEHRVLSVKNTGTDVGGRNDRQCRLWIHLWSLYANL